VIATRERARRFQARLQRRREITCHACWQKGHTRRTCPAPLYLWTNGPDFMIASSAERCARIFNDPLGPDSEEDLYSKPSDWRRIEEKELELVDGDKRIVRPVEDWIFIYREGLLAIDGPNLVRRDP
jgi:hypothetical protein